MLPTFVIGLREGLEASLIVGIVLAFLKRNGRSDLMRWAMLGVGLAILLCLGGGIGLYLVANGLPQRQQEALETVIGVIAVAMVTYMVVWMKRHSRDLKKQLEGVAGTALAQGSAWALVGMAFLAVLREGFETAFFLVAAFDQQTDTVAPSVGVLLGIALAIVLGYGIYRGGVRINLSKFFRVTGFVLVLVAAGLVQTAFRTAHEAGWVNWGQQSTVDLSAVIDPGSVQSALITGMLGIQPQPRLIEFVAWLLYLVPLGVYVAWPQGRGLGRRAISAAVAAAAVVTGLVAGALVLWAPSAPAAALSLTAPVITSAGQDVGDVAVAVEGDRLRVAAVDPVTGELGAVTTLPATAAAGESVGGIATTALAASFPAVTSSAPLTFDQIAELNGGRLPLGVRAAGAPATGTVPTTSTEQVDVTVSVSRASQRIVAVTWSAVQTVVVQGATGDVTIQAAEPTTASLAEAAGQQAVAAARSGDDALSSRTSERAAAQLLGVVAGLLALVALGVLLSDLRRRPTATPSTATPSTAAPNPAATSEGASARPTKTLSA